MSRPPTKTRPPETAVAAGSVHISDLSGRLHAVDAATGRTRWTFATDGEIKSSPVVVGDRVLIGSYDTSLCAVSVKDGSRLWAYRTNNYVHATPAIADGIAYFGGCDEVFRGERVSDGGEALSIEAGAYTAASPAVDARLAVFGTFDNDVLAIDLEKRTLAWRYRHAEREFPYYSSAAAADTPVSVALRRSCGDWSAGVSRTGVVRTDRRSSGRNCDGAERHTRQLLQSRRAATPISRGLCEAAPGMAAA